MRKLTLKRKRRFVAAIMKIYIYLEVDGQGDLTLDDINCRKVGTLKNGASLNIDVPNKDFHIFVVYDKRFPQKFFTKLRVHSGENDIILNTKAKYDPFRGNPFVIY
ncbi:MAG: hypothetical protein KAH13_00070 [Tenericutes bacterium]|nr:hypothetical protein [Mycoplasmatota bacterium]